MRTIENYERLTRVWGHTRPYEAMSERISAVMARRVENLTMRDERTREHVLRFVKDRYGVSGIEDLPPRIAREIVKRPEDFVHAAKQWCEPELL